jgi:hypothetical protein
MRNECGKCSGYVNVSDKEIAEQMKKVIKSGVPLADEKLYNERLKVCNDCERLAYGTTCMSCGCFVKIRALYALRICPHESGNKW